MASVRFEDDLEIAKFSPRSKGHTVHASKNTEKNSLGNTLPRKVLSRVFSEDYNVVKKTIFDPRGAFISKWNNILFAACLTSLFVDPLFFLLPQATKNICIDGSATIEVALTAIRSLADVFYAIRIFIRFRTAYVAPSSRVYGRGELVVDPSKIASRYLHKEFWLDILAALPLPQVVIWAVIPRIMGLSMDLKKDIILIFLIIQYLLRLYLIVPLGSEITKAAGVVLERAWAGAAFNLLLFMLASHIFGCLWYHLAIERQVDCWREVCSLESVDCHYSFLACRLVDEPGRLSWLNSTNVSRLCEPSNGFFEFGIYADALTLGVTSSSFFRRFFYLLWWALRNLTSLGQGLATSTYPGEVTYAMILGIVSLVLFGLLIGNMQTYLQSTTARLEQWRISKTDTERWMRHRQLPHAMRQSVRRHNQHKWCTTRGVDEEAILKGLPMDLRRVITRHLCLDLVRKVPLFDMMDEQVLDAICEKLKPCLYDRGACVDREGDPVNEMLFIVRGRLDSCTTDGGRPDFFNSSLIGPGDFCGEELLTWALDPCSSVTLPYSTRTVIAITEVEAFAFIAEDLKFVASQFRRLNCKKLRYVFRFHSHQWRTWAACSIQAAWFRYKKRKESCELSRIKRGLTIEQLSPYLLQTATNVTMHQTKLAAR